MKKKILAVVACVALAVSSASAVEVGLGGGGGYEAFLGDKKFGGVGYGYGEAFAYTIFTMGKFDLGVDVGFASRPSGVIFAGVSGAYNFGLLPGLSLYPKVGVGFSFLWSAGLDITAGVGVSYDFTDLIKLGLVIRAEALFDTYIGFASAPSLGPQFRVAVGYKFS